jgi:hypothetical protein
VNEILGTDAAARDIENKSPRTEVALLKSSGLTKILGRRNTEVAVTAGSWDIRLLGR